MQDKNNDPVYTYRRNHVFNPVKKQGKNWRSKYGFLRGLLANYIKTESWALGVMGFFLGRALLLGELYPFGVAFAAGVFWVLRPYGFSAMVGVLAGLLTVAQGSPASQLLSQVLCVFLASLGAYLIPSNIKRPWMILPGLVFSVVMVVRASFLALAGALPYNYISVFFEAVFAALFVLLVIKAVPSLFLAGTPNALKSEELFCVMALAGSVVAGTGEISWACLSLKSILSYFFILIVALAGGSGLGAAAGVLAGAIPGLAGAGGLPAIVGVYSFSGLVASLFRSLGKAGVVMGFLLGQIILSMYMTSYDQLAAVVAQTAVAAVMLFIIPPKWVDELKILLSAVVNTAAGGASYEEQARQLVAEKVSRWPGVFKEMARSFEQTSATGYLAGEEQNLQSLFNEVGKKVCKGCTHYATCWDREFYKTYQNLLALLAVAENYGRVTVDDLDDETAAKCSRVKELAITVTCLHEMLKLNRFWSSRLQESSGLVGEQLAGIGEIIEGLVRELEAGGKNYKQEARAIRHKLGRMGFNVSGLEIYDAGGEYPEVNITMPFCGGRMICRYEIGPFLSREMDCQMSTAAVSCTCHEDKEFCNFRLYPHPKYQLSLGAAGRGKEGSAVSGDSHMFLSLPGGRFALLLSDGMGSGPSAASESRAALELVARLLDSGFSRDLAIRTVNSILLLRSPEENFATIDMTVLDLYTAGAEFAKIGACPGFVVREHQIGTIRANSLPVGIVHEVEVCTVSKQLDDGDLIVMVTDGVLEACDGGKKNEEWLLEVLREISGLKPQEVAELIVNLAQTASRRDDMTVLVAKIEKIKNN